jgi:hypothetical protein
MPFGRRIRRWKQRLAAWMRRWAATLDGTPSQSTPRDVAAPRRKAGPPAHWLAHIEKAGTALSWIEPGDPEIREREQAEHAAPDSPRAPTAVPSERLEVRDRFTAPRKRAPDPSTDTHRARPASGSTPPIASSKPATPSSHPPSRGEDSSRTSAVPRPPPASPTPGAIVHRREFASPPRPPPRLRSLPGSRPQVSQAPTPSKAPSPVELPPVARAAAPRAPAPVHPRIRIPRPAGVEAPPIAPARPAPLDRASPFRSVLHPVRPLASDVLAASRTDPRRTRPATPEPSASPPLAPPWPELARRGADPVRTPPPVAAPWPELLIPSDDPVERAFDELERTSRVDALAAQLGEKPWNASPS